MFFVYREVKTTSGPMMDSKELNKQIAKTLAVAVAFGVRTSKILIISVVLYYLTIFLV